MLAEDGEQLSGRRNLALGLIREGTDLRLHILLIVTIAVMIVITVTIFIARMIITTVTIVINIGVEHTWKAAEEPQQEGSPDYKRL